VPYVGQVRLEELVKRLPPRERDRLLRADGSEDVEET
jgi:hypothetical protein